MKKLMLSLSVLLLATACDNPQRSRMPTSNSGGNSFSQNSGTAGTNPWGAPTTTGTTGSTSGSTSTGSTTTSRPPGFENCDISAKYYAAGINYMGICQSTTDETSVAVNSTVSEQTRTCLIPTYKDGNGNSTYLGQPQCYSPEQGKVSQGNIYKTRAGFTENPINGVMVVKEASIGAYFTCMNAYVNYVTPQCPGGPRTSPYCAQQANADMATRCNNFKADNAYIDIRLK